MGYHRWSSLAKQVRNILKVNSVFEDNKILSYSFCKYKTRLLAKKAISAKLIVEYANIFRFEKLGHLIATLLQPFQIGLSDLVNTKSPLREIIWAN
jgi:hypothetical protein